MGYLPRFNSLRNLSSIETIEDEVNKSKTRNVARNLGLKTNFGARVTQTEGFGLISSFSSVTV